MALESPQVAARRRRQRAALKYKPSRIHLLLVAEAPPAEVSRYFYFEEVTEQDSLFHYVALEITGSEPTRANKAVLLSELRDRGVFLIDLKPDPLDGSSLIDYVPNLVSRCHELRPSKIILIKVTVYDAAHTALAKTGLPVVNERIPFPGSGQQQKFQTAFRRALKSNPIKAETQAELVELAARSPLLRVRSGSFVGVEVSQPVTAVDIKNGRVRFPRAAKRLLPGTRTPADVILRGARLQGSYDPRTGPDRERSAVLRLGRRFLDPLVREGERLRVSVDAEGTAQLN